MLCEVRYRPRSGNIVLPYSVLGGSLVARTIGQFLRLRLICMRTKLVAMPEAFYRINHACTPHLTRETRAE